MLCKVAKWLEDSRERGDGELPRQVVVFSDAKSVLDALQNWPAAANDPILGEVVRVVDTLINEGSSVIFQWVPGHCGVPGNVKADVLAYKGSLRGPQYLVSPGTSRWTRGLQNGQWTQAH